MNTYCKDCSGVSYRIGACNDTCNDCGSTDLATEPEIVEELFWLHIKKSMPEDIQTRLGVDQWKAVLRAFAPHLDLQEAILNGPLAKVEERHRVVTS